jgi:hypothetical protein
MCAVRVILFQWQPCVPVGQVEMSPEILLVYRADLVLAVSKISAADTLCKVETGNAEIWSVQFKFAPSRMRLTTATVKSTIL